MLSNGSYTRTYGAESRDLRPEFFMDTVKNEGASVDAGREIFNEVERVKIIIPGAVATVAVHNVKDEHRARWPREYEAFRKGQEIPLTGTPIEEWPLLNRSMVAELKRLEHLGIRTVEDLANLSDYQLQSVGMGGPMLRQRARAFLDSAEREALTGKLTAENDLLRSRVRALENQINELSAHVSTLLVQNRQLVDRPDPIAGFVQGDHDPLNRPGAAARPGGGSALDALASLAPPAAPTNLAPGDAAPALEAEPPQGRERRRA